MKSFILKSTVLTLLVFILGAALYSLFFQSVYFWILPFLPFLFFTVTNLVHNYLLKVAVKSPSRFTSRYMAASFLKMFFYLAVGIGYAFINKEHAKIFLVNFLLLYIIYTTFEVVELSRVMRHKVK